MRLPIYSNYQKLIYKRSKMEKNNQIYLKFNDEEKLPYVVAYIKKHIPYAKESDIRYKRGNECMSHYFIVERYREGRGYRSVIDVKLSGKITPVCIAELNIYTKILSVGNGLKTERVFIVNPDCDTSNVPDYIKTIRLDKVIRHDKSVA
jgi:hypothetical protein